MSALRITWEKMGSEFTYNILYSLTFDGPWFRHNQIILTDTVGTYIYDNEINEYNIDNLLKSRNYYVKITCNDRYKAWWIGYTGEDSVDGGYGHDEDAPSAPFDNTLGLKINIL